MLSKKKSAFLLVAGLLLMTTTGLGIYYFLPCDKIPEGMVIDHILVIKSRHELQAYAKGALIVTYKVALGRNKGRKTCEGDRKTPEGIYIINERNPHSDYHKNLGISYPNDADREQARRSGKPAGGLIKIHGLKNGRGYIGRFHRWQDWTLGCIALDNEEMDELYAHTPNGTPIEIRE